MKLEVTLNGEAYDPTDAPALELDEVAPGVYSALVGERSLDVYVRETPDGRYEAVVDGRRYAVGLRDPRAYRRNDVGDLAHGPRRITAPMPGKIVAVEVEVGQEVETDQGLLVVEAMKMQNEIRSPKAGKVTELLVAAGDSVTAGQPLIVIE